MMKDKLSEVDNALKDQALENLFLAARPTFNDEDAFMSRLNRRLDAVEYLKQHEEATIRRYRWAMIAVFVLGIVCGCAMLTFFLSMPADSPLISFNVQSGILLFVEQYSRPMAMLLISVLIGYALICIAINILDIANMKERISMIRN